LFASGNNAGVGTSAYNGCLASPPGGLQIYSKGGGYGQGAWWYTTVPSGWLTITQAKVWYTSGCPLDGISGEFDWNDYGQDAHHSALCGGNYVDYAFGYPVSSFGWQNACTRSRGCDVPGGAALLSDIQGVWLQVHDGAGPTLAAAGTVNLWWHGNHFVRGDHWPVDLLGGDITGVCHFFAIIDGNVVARGDQPLDQSQWHQCDGGDTGGSDQYGNRQQHWLASIDSSSLSDGWHTYQIADLNAAGNWGPSNDVERVGVDNQPVSLSLTGPADASVAAGTQYVSATATSGPSGVGAINCSNGGGPWTSEPLSGAGTRTASAKIAVAGLGPHRVSCYAVNQAQDANGAPAASEMQTWALKIGQPVAAAVSFSKVNRGCHRARRRVRVGNHTRIERVLVCHTVTRTRSLARVPYGHGARISGWVSILDGPAIGHVPVAIMTAPDNGSYAWRRAAVVTTAADGTFTAMLRPGPSRLVEAVYSGGPVTEPATSRVARLIVPANIRLTDVPTHVPWGGAGLIQGRVLGGHIPRGAQILKLLVGLGGRHLRTIGNPNIRPDGRFAIRVYATGSGGPERLQVAVGTLRERDYPYSPGTSRRVWITLG
jgi:hypothetical protein